MLANTPTVLLVDDDEAMKLYVQAALGHLDIDLVCCDSVAQASAALQHGPVRLVITDLRLAGESGVDLIEQMQANPSTRHATKIAVVSAALDDTGVQERLQRLGVWRALCKPLGLETLEKCVRDALGDAPQADAPCPTPLQVPAAAQRPLAPNQQSAVEEFFGGDGAMYRDYRATCCPLFALDIEAGEASIASGNLEPLLRVAHNLKSVLKSLGEDAASGIAERLEAGLASGDDRYPMLDDWAALRAALRGLSPTG